MSKSSEVLGVDIGGSHITSAIVNLTTRTIHSNSFQRKAVNSNAPVDEIISSWAEAIIGSIACSEDVIEKLGIAMPGPFDYEKGISLMKDNGKYAALFGLDVKVLLAEKLHLAPAGIAMANDAGCFLKGEMFAGVAKEYNSTIGITLGTGLGTAICNNAVTEDADLWCMPFRDSIAEEYLCTRWFTKRYYELSGTGVKDVKEIAGKYYSDANAVKVFDEFTASLAAFLQIFISTCNPQAIVLGGNIAKAEALFFPKLKEHLLFMGITLPVLRATLGEDAAILGASALWYE